MNYINSIILSIFMFSGCINYNQGPSLTYVTDQNTDRISEIRKIKSIDEYYSRFDIYHWGEDKTKISYKFLSKITAGYIEEKLLEDLGIDFYQLKRVMRNIKKPNPGSLNIMLDTNNILPLTVIKKRMIGKNEFDTIQAYPVIVKNISNDTLSFLQSSNATGIIIEALDGEKKWKTIATHEGFVCGTGIYNYPIYPKEIIATAIPVFKGEVITKGRIKIYEGNYSNEFTISVNRDVLE